jgi:hypothetical protein
MFGDLMNKIFHHGAAAQQTEAPTPAPHRAPGTAAPAPSAAPSASATATATAAPVDVEAVLNRLAAQSKEKLNWRTSIVDLMKLVGMDSSMANRKALAAELHYTGDTNDSAAMNIWLHKQVMKKLAENGGKVPADLLD